MGESTYTTFSLTLTSGDNYESRNVSLGAFIPTPDEAFEIATFYPRYSGVVSSGMWLTYNVTGLTPGDATFTVVPTILEDGVTEIGTCSASFDVSVLATPDDPWWQATGSVVSGGNLTSSILPAGENFLLDSEGGQPGTAMYKESLDTGNGAISSTGWKAHLDSVSGIEGTSYEGLLARVPSVVESYFASNNIPDTIDTGYISSNGFDHDGYSWFKRTGDLLIDGNVTVLNKKVVLFVDGNLTINGDTRLASTTNDFFMIVAGGNITLNGTSTASLEGIYFADGIFDTGTGTTALATYGTVVTNGGITLARDLEGANPTTPAETFVFAPELYLNYPTTLSPNKIIWREVAP